MAYSSLAAMAFLVFALPATAGCRFEFSPSNVNSTQIIDYYTFDGTSGPWPYANSYTIGTLEVTVRPVDEATGAYSPYCRITGLAFSEQTRISASRSSFGAYEDKWTFARSTGPSPTWMGETYYNYWGYAYIGYNGVDDRTGATFTGSFDFQLVINASTGT